MAINRESRDLIAGALPELLFATLPLLVIGIVSLAAGRSLVRLLSSPEWSFGSAVLFGQAIVKIVRSTLGTRKADPRMTAVVIALMLVGGLAPSLVILALLVFLERCPTAILIVLQMLWFGLAALTFMLIGGLADVLEPPSGAPPGDAPSPLTAEAGTITSLP